MVKLKRDLKYKSYAYFEPIHPNSAGLSSKDLINFSDIDEHQDVDEHQIKLPRLQYN